MKRLMLCLMVFAFALSSTACFHNQVITSPDYDPAQEEPDHSEIQIHIFGLVNVTGPVNLEETCPQGAGIVESRTFVNGWVSEAAVHCTPEGAELDDTTVEEKLARSSDAVE